MLLSIGGVAGLLELPAPDDAREAAFVAELRRRYAGFVPTEEAAPSPAFRLRLTLSEPRPPEVAPSAGPIQPTIHTSGNRLQIDRWDFGAVLERPHPEAPFSGTGQCQATSWGFESLLRVLWSVLLPRAGGGLVHACGFLVGEPARPQAIVAAGPSGAGKTTLARKVNDVARVLSDEAVAVHRGPAGRWHLSGTPFFGELQRGRNRLGSWPLAALLLLRKADDVRVSRVSAAVAVLRVLECLMCFETDAATAEHHFALVVALCAEVPVLQLESRTDTSVEEILQHVEPFWAAHPSA